MSCKANSEMLASFIKKDYKSMNGEERMKSSHVIKIDKNSTLYIRDGVRCYLSHKLRLELYTTDGLLQIGKESEWKHVAIDYSRRLVRFREKSPGEQKCDVNALFAESKDIPFSEIIDVKAV